MGPRFPLQRLVWCALFLVAVSHSLLAQSTYTGRCRVTSNPLQVRAKGVTERLGDIVLECSGSTPGTVLTGNLILFFPIVVTNRIDSNNQTHDAMISVNTGSGFVPSAFAGLVSGNSISAKNANTMINARKRPSVFPHREPKSDGFFGTSVATVSIWPFIFEMVAGYRSPRNTRKRGKGKYVFGKMSQATRSADIPVCGFTGLFSPVQFCNWRLEVARTRRLKSLRYEAHASCPIAAAIN